MRERGQNGNAASGTGRRLLGWGFFDRPIGEFSAGVDMLAVGTNIQHQQNLIGRRIAIVALGNASATDRVVAAVSGATPGSYAVVEVP